jgi:hypothetical protein
MALYLLNDIGGKIAAGINDTGGKFCHQFRSVVDTGGKFAAGIVNGTQD